LLQLRCSPERTEGAVVRRTTVTRRTTYGRNLHREVWIWIKGGRGDEKKKLCCSQREKGALERERERERETSFQPIRRESVPAFEIKVSY
jgi:hypothetical protein